LERGSVTVVMQIAATSPRPAELEKEERENGEHLFARASGAASLVACFPRSLAPEFDHFLNAIISRRNLSSGRIKYGMLTH
jgi:hypothetical protein